MTDTFYQISQSFLYGGVQDYFSYSGISQIRESIWILINLSLATAIAWLRKKLGEEETVEALQKENIYYKLRYYRSQLNPHFLFTILNSI